MGAIRLRFFRWAFCCCRCLRLLSAHLYHQELEESAQSFSLGREIQPHTPALTLEAPTLREGTMAIVITITEVSLYHKALAKHINDWERDRQMRD